MKACGLKRKLCKLLTVSLCLFCSAAVALDIPGVPIDLPIDLPIINVLSPLLGDEYLLGQPILVTWEILNGDIGLFAKVQLVNDAGIVKSYTVPNLGLFLFPTNDVEPGAYKMDVTSMNGETRGESGEFTIRSEVPGSLRGVVLKSGTNAAVTGASVRITPPNGGQALTVPTSVTGDFQINSLPKGTYTVSVSKQWYYEQGPFSVTVASGQTAQMPVVYLQPQYVVPDVRGLDRTTAENFINAAGLTLGCITEAFSSAYAPGAIMSQTPTFGSEGTPGLVVDLIVSLGSESIATPRAAGVTASDGTYPDGVLVAWEPQGDATAFQVYRSSTPNPCDAQPISGWIVETTFVDGVLPPANGDEGSGEEEDPNPIPPGTDPPAQDDPTGDEKPNEDPQEGPNTDPFDDVAASAGCGGGALKLSAPTAYYWVRARTADGVEGPLSNPEPGHKADPVTTAGVPAANTKMEFFATIIVILGVLLWRRQSAKRTRPVRRAMGYLDV